MTTDIAKILVNHPPQETGKYQVLGWMPTNEYAAPRTVVLWLARSARRRSRRRRVPDR